MKKIFCMLLAIAIALSACKKDDDSIHKGEFEQQKMVYDAELNMYVPVSFYYYEYTIVKELPDPAALLSNQRLKAGPLPQPSSDGGMIVDSRQIPASNNGSGIDEVSKTLPSGYVVTGVAANINSSKNYNSLMLEYR